MTSRSTRNSTCARTSWQTSKQKITRPSVFPFNRPFLLTSIVSLPFLLGGLGFVWFVVDAARPTPALPPPQCGGLVALTGGKDRVSSALTLLKTQPSRQLLISGVAPESTLDEIAMQNGVSLPPGLSEQISLGRRAISTIGNGRETAQWAQDNGLGCLVVITAGYHMRRALLEIHQAAPALTLIAWRVQPPAMQTLWRPASLRILLHEYAKFLGAYARDSLHPPGQHHGLRSQA